LASSSSGVEASTKQRLARPAVGQTCTALPQSQSSRGPFRVARTQSRAASASNLTSRSARAPDAHLLFPADFPHVREEVDLDGMRGGSAISPDCRRSVSGDLTVHLLLRRQRSSASRVMRSVRRRARSRRRGILLDGLSAPGGGKRGACCPVLIGRAGLMGCRAACRAVPCTYRLGQRDSFLSLPSARPPGCREVSNAAEGTRT
jgi:hypothetical protein